MAKSIKDGLVETLKVIREVDEIVLKGKPYQFIFSDFIPAEDDGYYDVLNVYVEDSEYEEKMITERDELN